jgi:hypothetical protein
MTNETPQFNHNDEINSTMATFDAKIPKTKSGDLLKINS